MKIYVKSNRMKQFPTDCREVSKIESWMMIVKQRESAIMKEKRERIYK